MKDLREQLSWIRRMEFWRGYGNLTRKTARKLKRVKQEVRRLQHLEKVFTLRERRIWELSTNQKNKNWQAARLAAGLNPNPSAWDLMDETFKRYVSRAQETLFRPALRMPRIK
jgi:hypothetical protein